MRYRKYWHSIRWHSIQFKLTISFLIILIPLVAVSMFSNSYSHRMLYDQITERTRGTMLTTLDYVDELTKNMDQQTLLIGSNPNLVDVWRGGRDPLNRDNLYEVHTVQQQLTALTNVNGAVMEAFIVHGASGNGVSTLQGGIKWPNVRDELWFRRTVEAGGGLVVHAPSPSDNTYSAYLSNEYIYYARLLDVFRNNREPNVMVLVIDKSSLAKIINHMQTSPNIGISLFYNGNLTLESNPIRAANNRMFSIEVDNGTWSMLLQQPEDELFLQPRRLQSFTYLIIGISILLAVYIAWLVYISISKPLRLMSRTIKRFSGGDLSAQIDHRRKDEFGYLMNSFNLMAEAQRTMIEEDYEKELRLARAEFSLLQSQINPHFLYNTLDSIYSVAMKNRISEISDMVMNLAQFFRVSLGKGRSSFTLEETIEHLMFYIRVQQIRTEHFTVDIELEEKTKRLHVLKLLLQPIVENAIVHGLGKSALGGELSIRARLIEARLHVEIQDTGIGIPEQELASIREELDQITCQSYRVADDRPFRHYFGLKNVKARLKLYYGDQADLRIESREGEGTKVTLILQQREDDKG
ncbi:sensor histidine kinase [Paenibacillus chungangensis]|uniref:histidine kinase n=1 Tax=Paenibacillus chungangensis TaxID=696535 RepID=A0ABW3HLM2_9BACL